MSALLVWLNEQEVRLFFIETEMINVKKLPYDNQQLVDEIKIKPLKQILLMGPGQEPMQFSLFLAKSYPDVYGKIIGVEKVNKMPDSEILSTGSRILQKYYLYNAG